MGKIVEYLVVTGSSLEILGNDMRHMLRDGWQPQGGIALGLIERTISEDVTITVQGYAQAVVKYEN